MFSPQSSPDQKGQEERNLPNSGVQINPCADASLYLLQQTDSHLPVWRLCFCNHSVTWQAATP
jgi:hypothetical protein